MQPRDLAERRAGLHRRGHGRSYAVVAVVMVVVWLAVPYFSADSSASVQEADLNVLEAKVQRLEQIAQPVLQPLVAATVDVKPAIEQASAGILPLEPSITSLVRQPLPNCSVVFFHHIEKTAGTTLRSIFQRHAQLGHFDFISFVNRYNKLQFQMVLHRLDALLRRGQAGDLRLLVEIHIGGGGYEHFLKYTLPDLLLLRAKLRHGGCRCNLVTLLRHPLMAHISWHHHFVNHRIPLCFWNSPYDCQARMSMALACHGGPAVQVCLHMQILFL